MASQFYTVPVPYRILAFFVYRFVPFWALSLAVFRFCPKSPNRTVSKIRPFSIFYSKKTENGWDFGTITVWFTLKLNNEKRSVYNDGTAHAELFKTKRFQPLNGTLNAFLIQNGIWAVLLVRYGSRFKNSDEKRSKPSHGTVNGL
jgi:hypothetical protein